VTLGVTSVPPEVVLVSVVDGSEAERAGLAPGDVLLAVDGAPVQTMEDARARLNGPIANDVLVAVRRNGTTLSLRVAREAIRR
jgi:C-terminal processing protease CtpA/Prc